MPEIDSSTRKFQAGPVTLPARRMNAAPSSPDVGAKAADAAPRRCNLASTITLRWKVSRADRDVPQLLRGGSVAAYVIYQADVTDEARYTDYRAQAGPSVVAAGGRYLVRGGDGEAMEGDLPARRTVVIEFPTRAAAQAWYRSAEYAEIRKLRAGIATATLYVVDGVDL